MTDTLSKSERSKNMSNIKSKNTSLEVRVRSYLHRKGFRYRIHAQLPGKPDLVFPKKKIVVFINGCFWHGHDCESYKIPATNTIFWSEKIKKNKARDILNIKKLEASGWSVITVWQCELKNKKKFEERMKLLSQELNILYK
jgi:DNA mismatch endonuclease (patch repair protein)